MYTNIFVTFSRILAITTLGTVIGCGPVPVVHNCTVSATCIDSSGNGLTGTDTGQICVAPEDAKAEADNQSAECVQAALNSGCAQAACQTTCFATDTDC